MKIVGSWTNVAYSFIYGNNNPASIGIQIGNFLRHYYFVPFGFGSAFVWNLGWSQQFSQNLFMLYSLTAQLLKVARYIQYIEILYKQELKVVIYILCIDYST